MALKTAVITLHDGADGTPLQTWLDEHPTITSVRITANGNYVILIYEEA